MGCKIKKKIVDNLEWCDAKYNLNYGKRRIIASLHIKKPILQCDLDGNVIKEWCGAIDASKELEPGKKVRILEGPFKDMEGTIESVDMKTQKLNVNVDLFGQATKVEVDLADISSID